MSWDNVGKIIGSKKWIVWTDVYNDVCKRSASRWFWWADASMRSGKNNKLRDELTNRGKNYRRRRLNFVAFNINIWHTISKSFWSTETLGVAIEKLFLKARSHDPFLRIRFLVPKTGSRHSDGPISRFRFCGENVERSFVVCSYNPFFRTNKGSSIWRQNDHAKFVGAFHLLKRVSDENRACSISTRLFKITDPFDGRSFLMCSHDLFFGTNKNRILKNGSCEQVLRVVCPKSNLE